MSDLNKVLQDAILTAVGKSLKSKDLPPGEWSVNHRVVFNVAGTVRKGDPIEYTPTVDIPLLTTLALVLEKSGITRERSIDLLTEAMQEALALGQQGENHVASRVNDIQTAMARVREVTDALPKKVKNGIVTFKGNVETEFA